MTMLRANNDAILSILMGGGVGVEVIHRRQRKILSGVWRPKSCAIFVRRLARFRAFEEARQKGTAFHGRAFISSCFSLMNYSDLSFNLND